MEPNEFILACYAMLTRDPQGGDKARQWWGCYDTDYDYVERQAKSLSGTGYGETPSVFDHEVYRVRIKATQKLILAWMNGVGVAVPPIIEKVLLIKFPATEI